MWICSCSSRYRYSISYHTLTHPLSLPLPLPLPLHVYNIPTLTLTLTGELTKQLVDSFVDHGGDLHLNTTVDQIFPMEDGPNGLLPKNLHGGLSIPFPIPSFLEDGLNQVQKDVSSASRSMADNLNFAYKVGSTELQRSQSIIGEYARSHKDEDGVHYEAGEDKKIWGLTLHKTGVSSENSLDIVDVKSRFVFVGAGGMSLIMLEKVSASASWLLAILCLLMYVVLLFIQMRYYG